MAWTDSIPAVGNTISSDIAATGANFAFLKVILQNMLKTWSASDADLSKNAIYIVDADEADQGAAGAGNSFKDLVDAIGGTKNAIILFPHRAADGNTTTYTFTTGDTSAANVLIRIEPGARITVANGQTVTFGLFDYHPPFQYFYGDGNVVISGGGIGPTYKEWYATEAKAQTGLANLDATFADGDATPSIGGAYRQYYTANTSATTITDFDEGCPGQTALIYINDDYTIIDNVSSSIIVNGHGYDIKCLSNDMLRIQRDPNGYWLADLILYTRPNFSSYVSSTLSNVTGDGTAYTVVFDSEAYDIDASHDVASGIFTAKRNGPHLFTAMIIFAGITTATDTNFYASIVQKRTGSIIDHCTHFRDSQAVVDPAAPISLSKAFHLTNGDTVQVIVCGTGGTKVIDVSGGAINAIEATSMFSGSYLG